VRLQSVLTDVLLPVHESCHLANLTQQNVRQLRHFHVYIAAQLKTYAFSIH